MSTQVCPNISSPCRLAHLCAGKGDQDGHISWWPKFNTWKQSGYNVGYWSKDCETWYQNRLQKIREGTAELHNASTWRGKLKEKAGHTATFVNATNELADMVLRGNTEYWIES
jgi:hypothetical protein